MLIPDLSILGLGAEQGLDPSLSLAGAKKYLAKAGFKSGFGTEEVKAKFENFVDQQAKTGQYAGKSLDLGQGGRAAILRHKLIISGKYGKSLKDISAKDWDKINQVVKFNAIRKLHKPS